MSLNSGGILPGGGIGHQIVVLGVPQGHDHRLLGQGQKALFQDVAHLIHLGDDVLPDEQVGQKVVGVLHDHVPAGA